MRSLSIGAIQPYPDYVNNIVLAANVAETYDVPTGAKYVIISGDGAFYVSYITDTTALVTNGTFAADSDWTKGGTWTIAAGVATRTASGTGTDLSQTSAVNLVSGAPYVTTVTVVRTAGSVQLVIGGTAGTARSSSNTFTETIFTAASDNLIMVRADATFAGSVDNLIVAPGAGVPSADVTGGVGNELITGVDAVPAVRDISGVSRMSVIASATRIVSMSFYADGGAWVR